MTWQSLRRAEQAHPNYTSSAITGYESGCLFLPPLPLFLRKREALNFSYGGSEAPVGYTIQKLLTLRQSEIDRDAQKKKFFTLRETVRVFTFLLTGEAPLGYTTQKLLTRRQSKIDRDTQKGVFDSK